MDQPASLIGSSETIQPKPRYVSTTSIQDLPNEILDYIFSFLDFIQRARIEVVCKRWRTVGSHPIQLSLRADIFLSRKLDDSMLDLILINRGATLKELTLKANADLTSSSVAKIGQYCPNLVTLELQLVGNAQLECLKTLAPLWLNLRVLRLTSYDGDASTYNEGLLAIANSCKALKCLHISHLEIVTLNWLQVINPNLHTFCLHHTCLKPEAMSCLMQRCDVLQVFALDNCELLNGRLLCEFLTCLKRTLMILRINHLASCFVQWCKALQVLVRLEVLQLFACENVDDNLMKVLAKKCAKLRFLDIGSTDVTDNGLAELQNLPGLKELKIGWKTFITGNGLELLVAKGVLQRVTIPTRNSSLLTACRNMSMIYPSVRFMSGEEEVRARFDSSTEAEASVLDSSWFV